MEDATAADALGTACTRPVERVAAALGLLPGARRVLKPAAM